MYRIKYILHYNIAHCYSHAETSSCFKKTASKTASKTAMAGRESLYLLFGASACYYQKGKKLVDPKFDSRSIEVFYARKISKIVGIKFDSWVRFVGKREFYCPNESVV